MKKMYLIRVFNKKEKVFEGVVKGKNENVAIRNVLTNKYKGETVTMVTAVEVEVTYTPVEER